MNPDFINRVVKTSLILALIVFPFLAVYVRVPFAVAYLLGCVWSCLNLFGIKFLVTQLISPDPKNKTIIVLLIFLKFPLIYLLGYLLVVWDFTPVYGLLWGFSSIFAVTVLKVISRSVLQLDTKSRVKTS